MKKKIYLLIVWSHLFLITVTFANRESVGLAIQQSKVNSARSLPIGRMSFALAAIKFAQRQLLKFLLSATNHWLCHILDLKQSRLYTLPLFKRERNTNKLAIWVASYKWGPQHWTQRGKKQGWKKKAFWWKVFSGLDFTLSPLLKELCLKMKQSTWSMVKTTMETNNNIKLKFAFDLIIHCKYKLCWCSIEFTNKLVYSYMSTKHKSLFFKSI